MTDPVKLQIGKWYRRRDGVIDGPVRYGSGYADAGYPLAVGEESYAEDGRYDAGAESARDLVEEVPAPAPTAQQGGLSMGTGVKLQVGKWYRRRDGRIKGPVAHRGYANAVYPFAIGVFTYTATGRYDLAYNAHRYDLVEEVPAPVQDDPAPKDEWQPISTAPRDGTEFLAWDSRTKKMDVCVWAETFKFIVPVQQDGEYGPSEDEFGYNTDDITHWRPLPEPPENSQ